MNTPKGHKIFRLEIDKEYNTYRIFEINRFDGETNSWGINNAGLFCYCDVIARNVGHAGDRMMRRFIRLMDNYKLEVANFSKEFEEIYNGE